MDNGFLPWLRLFIGKYKYWIVFGLFLLVILVVSDNSLVKRLIQKREIRDLQEQLRESAEQKRQNELIQKLFPEGASGINATRLVVRALELRILDIDNLEADEE